MFWCIIGEMISSVVIGASFVLGTIIGSFLNVLILRHGTGRSAVSDRSACWSCSKTLVWYELIPVVSYVFLRGRCVSCHTHISLQYPLVELLTGSLFALTAWYVFSANLIGEFLLWEVLVLVSFIAIILSLSVMMTVYDMRHMIIPNKWVYTFVGMTLLYTGCFHFFSFGTLIHWSIWDMAAGPILALPFAGIWFFSRGTAMGLADAKVALGIGWLLGLWGGVSALLIAFWSGAIIGLSLLGIHKVRGLSAFGKRFTIKSEIPFGPFLFFGMIVVFFFHVQALYLFL